MSESLKIGGKENPDAEKWEGIDSDIHAQQVVDSMNNMVLSNDLKENKKQREQRFQEDVFAARAAVLQSYNSPAEGDSEFERYNERQNVKENYEKYGENLTPEAARRCFSKEFVALQNKFNKVKRAEEKENKMSAKDSQKSYKKRLKDGIMMTAKDRKHLSEMDRMDAYQREEYGRAKRQEYMKIQKKKEDHPIKFAYLVRKNKLSIPEEWDDSEFSLNDLKHINSGLILLDDEDK